MAEDRSGEEGAPDMPLARDVLRRRRLRDAAAALQLGAAALFVSPFVDVFGGGGRIFGLPAGAVMLFGLWFLLIALAARLARLQAREEDGG